MRRVAILLASLVALMAGCSSGRVETRTFGDTGTAIDMSPAADPCPAPSQEPEEGDAGIAVAGAADAEPTITLPGGSQECTFLFKDIRVGDGDEVPKGATIRGHYVGMSWKTNEVFDSSWPAGDPGDFPLAPGGIIKGWEHGIPGMKEGGRRLLVIPPAFGYQERPLPKAAYDTLVFVIDVVEVV